MSTRLDLVIGKFPEHEAAVRALAARDPSGNLKYLDWGAKMVASGQALAPEVGDVIDLFHQFGGQRVNVRVLPAHGRRRRRTRAQAAKDWIRPDIYTYRPQDLAGLRDLLLKAKRARDRKRRKREQLYRIEGAVEAEVVYDATDLVVRHIKNKQASVHYGLSTKWCISMMREDYFEDYESHNATFFFFERRPPLGDEFDKVAVMFPRNREGVAEAFTALDRRVDMLGLAKVYGLRVFDIFRAIHVRSEQYPGSAIFHVNAGTATSEQVQAVFTAIKGDLHSYRNFEILGAICCNDAAPWSVLEEILRDAVALVSRSEKRGRRRGRRIRWRRGIAKEMARVVESAIVIHPSTPADVREQLTKKLRRRHIKVDAIHRSMDGDQIGVEYKIDETMHVFGHRRRRRYYHRRRPNTPKELRKRAGMHDRIAVRYRKRAMRLQRKLTEAKEKARVKKRAAAKRARGRR